MSLTRDPISPISDAQWLSLYVVPTLASTMIAYGVYVILFLQSLYILITRRKPWYFIATTIFLFTLATITAVSLIALNMWNYSKLGFPDMLGSGGAEGERENEALSKAIFALRVSVPLSYLVADFILVQRCYFIWGRSKLPMILPVTLYLVTCLLALVSAIDIHEDASRRWQLKHGFLFGFSIATNVTVTVMSAGRIWWVARHAKRVLGASMADTYSTITSMLLESGLFYSAFMVVTLSFNMLQDSAQVAGHNLTYRMNTVADVFLYLSAMFSGIMPTLLIVLVGLGADSAKVVATYAEKGRLGSDSASSGLRFAEGTATEFETTIQEVDSRV